jgi:hypothetical protein
MLTSSGVVATAVAVGGAGGNDDYVRRLKCPEAISKPANLGLRLLRPFRVAGPTDQVAGARSAPRAYATTSLGRVPRSGRSLCSIGGPWPNRMSCGVLGRCTRAQPPGGKGPEAIDLLPLAVAGERVAGPD